LSIIAPFPLFIICAESEARKNEPLLKIVAVVFPDDTFADNGEAADGREVDIVSLAFIKSAANDF